MHPRAASLITTLGLSEHPEGGYFREIFRSALQVNARDGRPERSALTVIYFLLLSGQVSCWHRVVSDEAWHFMEGDPLELHEADARFHHVVTHTLGRHAESTAPVHVVPAGCWQAARSTGEYTLVGCAVGPGFDFADFALLRDLPREAGMLRKEHPRFATYL
ncbi:MAG TPA: cupin domain-containing protein [Gemmatimonadaceae bacterium]|nr:cupin domain-containing protein [Gemmatimonadaceae bacterium]